VLCPPAEGSPNNFLEIDIVRGNIYDRAEWAKRSINVSAKHRQADLTDKERITAK